MDLRLVDIPDDHTADNGTSNVQKPASVALSSQVYPLRGLGASAARLRAAAWLTFAIAALFTPRSEAVQDATGVPAAQKASVPSEKEGDPTPSTASQRAYVLGVEDVVQVDVWKNPELTQEQAVRPDGRIAFKLIGEVEVEGLTVEQLRQRLTEMYREYVPAAEVSVVVKEINSFRVYILGKIQKPGEYKATSGLTMLQVLALSGPFMPYANVKEIRVFRRTPAGDQVLTFNYRNVVRGTAGDMDLFPGDRIVVP